MNDAICEYLAAHGDIDFTAFAKQAFAEKLGEFWCRVLKEDPETYRPSPKARHGTQMTAQH